MIIKTLDISAVKVHNLVRRGTFYNNKTNLRVYTRCLERS
jgi:hypothetical protein